MSIKPKNLAPLILRIGFFIVMLYPAIQIKFGFASNFPDAWQYAGLSFISLNPIMLILASTIYVLLLLMILVGYRPKIPAALLSLFIITLIVATLVAGSFDNLKVWKDLGILSIAIYFILAGTGPFSLKTEQF